MVSAKSKSDQNITISPKRLKEWLQNDRDPIILDVRPNEEFEDWSIPESISLDIYRELKSGHSSTLERKNFPSDRPIVTVCGAGKTSRTAAEQIRDRGLEAYSLEGGMKAWNFAWDTAEFVDGDDLNIIQIRRLAKGCLSYMIGSGDEAMVIDASLKPQVYLDLAEEKNWTIRYVADTHLHADFISRSRELAGEAGAEYLLGREADTQYPFIPLDDRQEIEWGHTKMTTLHHPGHTPESIGFLIEGIAVFTGDTLFTDGLGRPDLKANRQQALEKAGRLYESVHALLNLGDKTGLYPAHTSDSIRLGSPIIRSTIGTLEREIDLLDLPKEKFVEEVVSRIPPTPANYQTISRINRSGDWNGHTPVELEAGANRCAVS